MTDLDLAPPQPRPWIRGFLVILGVFLLFGGLWFWNTQPRLYRFTSLLEQVKNNTLTPDTSGRLYLAKSFPGLTPRDEAFAVHRADGSFLCFIPTYYGQGISIGGLLYTSRPLHDEDLRVAKSPDRPGARTIDVGSWTRLSLDGRIDEHWYHISRGLR